jgi:predicted DNA-binding transcriptional regulator AlpA
MIQKTETADEQGRIRSRREAAALLGISLDALDRMGTVNSDTIGRGRIRSRREAAELLGVSLATIDRMVRSGELPAPIHLSVRRVGWQTGVLLDWIASKGPAAA